MLNRGLLIGNILHQERPRYVSCIETSANLNCQDAVFILTGTKGKPSLYDDLYGT